MPAKPDQGNTLDVPAIPAAAALNPRPYQDLVENAPDAILLVDSSQCITYANTRAERLFGYARSKLIGRKVEVLIADPHKTQPAADAGEGPGKPRRREIGVGIEMLGRHKNGAEFPVEVSLSPILLEQETFVTAAVRDISTRKQVEAKLRASELRYRRLFETAQDGILILEADTGQVTDINPFLEEMLGYPHEHFLGKKLWELGAFKDIPESRAAFLELQKNGYVRYENLPLQTHDARQIEVEFVSNVYSVDDAEVIQCNIRDISDRKVAERGLALKTSQLETSNWELEQFAHTAAHDLKEPVSGIIGMAQILQQEYRNVLDRRGNEYLDLILQGASYMQVLLQDLLEYACVGRNDPVRETVDCEAMLACILAQLQDTVVKRQAAITHGPLPVLMGVPTEIHQLMQNLIANAIKFQPGDKPRVHVSARRDGNFWKFSVHDEGIGIPAEHQQKIFWMFQRLHSTEEYEGSGIGLALCEKIVRRHGGRIWVESEPGKGSTFNFTLPAGRKEPLESILRTHSFTQNGTE